MKRLLPTLAVLIFLAFNAHAQVPGEGGSGVKLNAGFGIGGTIGTHASNYPVAGQIHLGMEIPVSEEIPVSVMLGAGYTFFVSKDGYSASYNSREGGTSTGSLVSFVPLTVGARFYAGQLFFQGDVGLSFNLNPTHADYTGKNTGVIVAPSVGYGFKFGDKIGLDLSLAYEARTERAQENVTTTNPYVTSYGGYNQVAFHLAFSYAL
jgi:hypothetical protein